MKITYRMTNGHTSTAYLDELPAGDVRSGENKYTDQPILVRWDDGESEWVEVAK